MQPLTFEDLNPAPAPVPVSTHEPQTIMFGTWVYGDEPPETDDPAEVFHEASRFYPDVVDTHPVGGCAARPQPRIAGKRDSRGPPAIRARGGSTSRAGACPREPRHADRRPPVDSHVREQAAHARPALGAAPCELRRHRRAGAAAGPRGSHPVVRSTRSSCTSRPHSVSRGSSPPSTTSTRSAAVLERVRTLGSDELGGSDPVRRAPRAERRRRDDLRGLLALALQVRLPRVSLCAARGGSRCTELSCSRRRRSVSPPVRSAASTTGESTAFLGIDGLYEASLYLLPVGASGS